MHKQSCTVYLIWSTTLLTKQLWENLLWKRVLHIDMDIFSTHVFIEVQTKFRLQIKKTDNVSFPTTGLATSFTVPTIIFRYGAFCELPLHTAQ
jgi:hypothetical protein